MTAAIYDISNALVARLQEVPGLRVSGHPVETPNPPQAVVKLNAVEYHGGTMGGHGIVYRYQVGLAFGRSNSRGGWEQVERHLSPDGEHSVRAALLADQSLGGAATSVAVGDATDIGTVAQQDASYIVCTLEVIVRGR